jgi:hypothetical protein
MKIAAAIFLLGIFSFNIFGYRILYNYMAREADHSLELALDNNDYKDAELITIKKPINLPYYTNSRTYQRQDGEVNIEGNIYKYVKYRIYNDSLEMLCIPHVSKMQIENSKDQFFKLVNDIQQADKHSKKSTDQSHIKPGISEFTEITKQDISYPFTFVAALRFHNTSCRLQKSFIGTAERPPDLGWKMLTLNHGALA